jgi:mRNA interferase MazF
VTQTTHPYRRGDVVIVPVPFAGGRGWKRRPAVVVSSDAYHAAQPANILIARLSGGVARHQTNTHYTLVDWRAAGLRSPGVASCFLVTVEPRDVSVALGRLSERDLRELEARLRLSLDLPG